MCLNYRIVKRIFDIISATLLLLVISPLFVVLIVLTRIMLGSPVLFKQKRSGLNQRPFYIRKFRTMTNAVDEDGNILADELRKTTFGNFMRSTSLDELPELISIIKGDMSVIGPRPLPVEYDEYYTSDEKKRFLVRGGLIPPDSVLEETYISWDEQLRIESMYAKNLSFGEDLKIFLSAFKILTKRKKSGYGEVFRKSLLEERERSEKWIG